MTKAEIKRITAAMETAEKAKAKLAAARDELRTAVEDMADILESMDRACDDFGIGLEHFQTAVDAASELV